MDFGLLYEMAVPKPWGPTTEHDHFWNALAQVREAEAAGFTHVWAVEHHFREEFSHMGAPEVWLASVAQHTSTIRIGHGVVLLPVPFNHPIRVAERIGALDIMSNGRVEFGTGRSLAELELVGFGIDPAHSRPMWAEALEYIQLLWHNPDEPVSFDGEFFQVPPRKVFPRPVQLPHPPMWLASTSPTSYELAGEYGLGVLAFGMGTSAADMAKRINRWRTAMDTSPRDLKVRNENAGVFMMAFCAETDAEARRICESSFVNYLDVTVDVFLRWGKHRELPPGYEWYAKALEHVDQIAARMKLDYLIENKMVLVGSPDTLCEIVSDFQEAGATQMIAAMQLGTIPHEDVLRSIRLFGSEVIPNFRAPVEAVAAAR
jgi:alkanesulfonate monooxygenase SsuD/methylene tetrahydromethanopterin reductase-like flavin-dependent oxidoreductase (luciferase family)